MKMTKEERQELRSTVEEALEFWTTDEILPQVLKLLDAFATLEEKVRDAELTIVNQDQHLQNLKVENDKEISEAGEELTKAHSYIVELEAENASARAVIHACTQGDVSWLAQEWLQAHPKGEGK